MTTPPTQAEAALLRHQQAAAIAQQNVLLEQIAEGIARLRARLTQAGYQVYKHYELRHPSTGITFGSSYSGGEYQVTLTALPGRDRPLSFRLTRALIERDPMAVDTLALVLLAITEQSPYIVHTGAGNTVHGLQARVDGEWLLFGERLPGDEDGQSGDYSVEFDEGDDDHEDGFNNAHLDGGPDTVAEKNGER